jgi:hypothetical protein
MSGRQGFARCAGGVVAARQPPATTRRRVGRLEIRRSIDPKACGVRQPSAAFLPTSPPHPTSVLPPRAKGKRQRSGALHTLSPRGVRQPSAAFPHRQTLPGRNPSGPGRPEILGIARESTAWGEGAGRNNCRCTPILRLAQSMPGGMPESGRSVGSQPDLRKACEKESDPGGVAEGLARRWTYRAGASGTPFGVLREEYLFPEVAPQTTPPLATFWDPFGIVRACAFLSDVP